MARNKYAPVITSGSESDIPENAPVSQVVYDANATDRDPKAVIEYSLSGDDAGLFHIDAVTGEVTFLASPDYEAPADANHDNQYQIAVHANDGRYDTTQSVIIKVTDVQDAPSNNYAPVITSGSDSNVAENTPVSQVVYDVNAMDQDLKADIEYSLSGDDAFLFHIDAATGEVKFLASPDYEAPADVNHDNRYQITVHANDGLHDTTKSVIIGVTEVQDTLPPPPPPPTSEHNIPSLGTNLDGLAYWSTALPTIDLVKSAGNWIPQRVGTWDTGETLDLDASGWVHSLLPGQTAALLLLFDNQASPPNAHYVLTYTGEGTLVGTLGTQIISSQAGQMVVQASSTGLLTLSLTSTDPAHSGNYLRDIHVVREDNVALAQEGLTFNPEFLDKVDDFHTFRFMDWMSTNKIFDANGKPVYWTNAGTVGQIDWADRPLMTDAQWNHGVPVEALVEIANRTGSDAWFNMPTNASDDYIRGFAEYVRDHLRPDLNIHVEYSNEVWNWAFPQSHYAQAHAEATFGAGANWMEWYGMRAAQIGQIWNETFGEPATGDPGRVSIVYNTQFGWHGLENYGLNTVHWVDANGQHIRAADYFDEYAVTGYYGGNLNGDANAALVKSWITDPDGQTKALAALQDGIVNGNVPGYQYHEGKASLYGLSLVTYESGFGVQNPPSELNNQAYADFLIELQRQPEIQNLETMNYNAFKDAGGDLYMNFGIIGAPSKWGSWDALKSVNQDTSPRYAALTDWNDTVAPWYETGRDEVTFQNARYYVAGDAGETIGGTLHGYDVLVGGAGDDTFVPHGAGSTLNGLGGNDTAIFAGLSTDYSLAANSDGSWTISHLNAGTPDGSDVIRNIEQLHFADHTMTLGPDSLWWFI